MSTREMEECFSRELLEEYQYSKYISIQVSPRSLIVIDPFMLNVEDLVNSKDGHKAMIRARRPAWGVGDLHRFIHVLEIK